MRTPAWIAHANTIVHANTITHMRGRDPKAGQHRHSRGPHNAPKKTHAGAEALGQFRGGFTTIRAAFVGMVEAYGRPAANGAGIDAANLTQMPAEDILGAPRGAAPDLGAVERVSSSLFVSPLRRSTRFCLMSPPPASLTKLCRLPNAWAWPASWICTTITYGEHMDTSPELMHR